ncbi:hypothetical protein R3I93_012748 [Phoxinus phoxinus]|uniref:Transforming acidic coiled-coil-containing protein C-terminal domain-containing protein n=1 Tax=Phoxinus phoxinus TaxID=58324 RepID=A0AAN9CUN8_9TELE
MRQEHRQHVLQHVYVFTRLNQNTHAHTHLSARAPWEFSAVEPQRSRANVCSSLDKAAVHTDKVSPLKEKSVHTDSVTAEPQVPADEEEKTRRQEEEDKEELEFPHDLLPSIDLDLSTEFNLTWGTSLSCEQESLGEMKNETVALGGTANPLLAGLEHYMEDSPPVVGLMKSCDGDQVSTETASLSQNHLSSTPQQDVPSLNPLAVQVDYELQEALKECEDEMTALGITSHADTWTAGDLDRGFSLALPKNDEKKEQTEKAEVIKDFGSSSHKPIKFHEDCHENGAHKNDSSAGEEGVFSFRDYVLGKKLTDTCTAGAKDVTNIKDITENHSAEASQLSEAEQHKKSEIETKIDTAENIAGQQTTHSVWTGTQTTSEMDTAKETVTQDQSILDICSSKYTLEGESTQDENKINFIAHTTPRETGVLQELNPVIEEVTSSAKATQMKIEMHSQLISDLLACQSPHMDKHAGHTLHLEAKISLQPNTQKQVESGTQQQISGQIETNTKVGSSLEHQRPELGLSEQLSPEGKQLICSPPPEPKAHQAHFSLAEAPPALILHPPQGPEQHDDQDQTDGPYKSISEGETIHHNHCMTEEIKHEKNVSDASAVLIDFGQAKTAPEHEPEGRYDLETCPLEPENRPSLGSGADANAALWGNSHSLNRSGAEKEEEESALELASAESAASTLLQTPTMPEMIESEGEKKRDDAFQSVAIIVQAAERESTVLEADESPSSQGTLTEITAEQGRQCTSVIFPKIKSSPVPKEEAIEESCGNEMPHNSTESEGKGGGLPIALSPAGNKDTGTVDTEDKALVTYSSPGVLGTCDWKVGSSRSKQRKGESEEEGKETSEGGAQNAAHAGSVSRTETATETCPSPGITASLAATQDESDLILPVTAGTALFPLTINRINDCVSISPPPPLSHINSTETETEREEAANLNPSPSAPGAELLGSDKSFPPAFSLENECLAAQANSQQVQSSSQTRTTSCDTSIKTETPQQKQETTPTSEDTSLSTKLQVNMRDIAGSCTKVEVSPKGMRSSFEDQKDTALKGQMTECASLPPLMVFESLRHPVKETSFNFKGFLTINKPEIEKEKSSALKEPTAFDEGGIEERNWKQKKVEQVETTYKGSKDCRETTSTSQEQGETTVKLEEHVNVKMGGCEEGTKVIDETDVNKKNPVIFSSLSAADETTSVKETKDVVNEILEETEAIKQNQEYKESLNVTPISTNDTDESASTEKNSVLLQDVSLQEGRNSIPAVDGERADIAVSEGVEQRHIEMLFGSKDRLNEETDKTKGCGLPEADDIEVISPSNSNNFVNDSEEHELCIEKYTHEEESQVKTSSMSPAVAPDTDSMCPCTQPDKKINTEHPTTTSEVPLLSKADKCADMLTYQTESQFSGEIMKSDAVDAGDTTVPSLPAAETIVPAQSDLSLTTKQSTNSDARDVSVIVLKAPGPMLSHSESINDCDIAVAGTGEHCSVNLVCKSDTQIVNNSADKTNQQSDVNEDMLRQQNADDPPYTVGVSAQEIAASSGSLLLTTDRPEQAGCSPLVSKNPDIVVHAKMKENEASNGTVEFDIGQKGKREGHVNSKHENDLCNVPTNVTTNNELNNEDKSDHNKESVKEPEEESSANNETSASQEEGNEQKNGKQDERKEQEEMAFREQKDSRVETNNSEASCVDDMVNSQSALTTQSPNDLCNVPTNVTTNNELNNEDKSDHNKESVKETEEESSANTETSASQEEGNEQKNGKQDERKEQEEMAFREQKDSRVETNNSEASCVDDMVNSQSALTTRSPKDDIKCDSLLMHLQGDALLTEEPVQHVSVDNVRINKDVSEGFRQVMGGEQNNECVKENERHNVKSVTEKDSKERTNTPEEQDKTAAKEMFDQTQGENQTLINHFKLSGEEKILNETIPRGKLQSSFVPDPDLTSKGIIEVVLGCRGAPTEKSPSIIDQTLSAVVNAFPERDHTQDLKALSQSDLVFSQSQELQQQHKFVSAPEAVLSVGKSNGLENAETNNHADAEASETQEKVMVYCSVEAQDSLNSTSESAILVGGNDKDVAVYNACPQNEVQRMQKIDLSGGNFPVCVESIFSEIQTQPAPDLSVTALSASETSVVKKVIEATEAKEPSISASHESVSKHAECTKSQTSVDEHGNVLDEILDTKKGSELPINYSSEFSVLPSLSHHAAGLKTNEKYFGSVTPGDIENTEIRPDSMSDIAQMSPAGTSQLQQAEELVFQPSDSQLSTTSTLSASVLQESIKEDKEISVDHASKDAVESNAPNSSQQSETAAWRMEQLNKHLSEQFPVCTQNTEEQDTQCSEQQLMQSQHVRTCSGSENTISTMKAEDTVSNDRQQPEGIQEKISEHTEDEAENKTVEKECIEMSKRAETKSSESVVKESISKENQSKLEEHSLSSPAEAIVGNVDQPIEEVTDGTLVKMKKVVSLLYPETAVYLVTDPQDSLQPPLTVNQQSSQQPTKSFIQTLCETVTDSSKGSSKQNPDIADSYCGDIESLLTEKAILKDDSEVSEEEVRKVSESADVLLGSDPGTVQVSPVKESTDRQDLSVVFVPERSINSSESSDWLRAMKEAASISQIIQEHRDETTCGATENRPFETLDSPQAELEFRTPTEEYFPPAPDDSFPPAPEESLPFATEESFPTAPEESFPTASEESFPTASEGSFPTAPEESFLPVTEQQEEQEDCRPPLIKAAERSEPVACPSSPPPQHSIAPALPAHLLQDTVEFPTPPPTPPDRAAPEPHTLPPAPSDPPETPPLPPQIQQLQHSEPSARSSDSDGAFETPESTTPVKSASPPLPPTEHPCTSSEALSPEHTASTANISASEAQDPVLTPASRSQSTVFDEDKPIAASGAYNIEHLIVTDPLPESNFGSGPSSRAPLTRSLSLQSGELESPGDKSSGGTSDKPIHPRTESFSIGTESAPGTLRRVKKPRPGSLKKKPLSRQNSNPEHSSPKTVSSSSTPEEKKRGKPRPESPLQTQERPSSSPSPSPSPAGTLRRNRIKSRVESPPPLAEEITTASILTQIQPELPNPVLEAPTLLDEESPIPPSASYKWDPDNFENIDPFNTGGSKVANSPVLGRKADFTLVSGTPVAVEEPCAPSPAKEQPLNIEEQPIAKRQPVRLEFDYSEDSGEASRSAPPPKILGKKPGAKMPIRKPKLGIKKAPPPQTEQLDNSPVPALSNDNDDIPIPKASYNFDPSKWDDPNFNPFSSSTGVPNSPHLSKGSYSFDTDSFDDSIDPFKSSNNMGNPPTKAASFDQSNNENENDNIVELEDHNQNKPAKNKKKPLKSSTFRVKKSPKRTQITEPSAQEQEPDANPDPSQDHATDEEKLASSTIQKWTRHDVEVELTSDLQDFPQPTDFTAFVNENSLPAPSDVTEYEIEYMEKIGSSAPPLSVKKPSLYLKLDSVTDSPKKTSNMHDSEPNSPCTGSFEEMEAQISQGKSPVLPPRGARDPMASEKSRKRESQSQSRTQSNERDGVSPIQGPMDPSDLPLLDRLSDSPTPLSYLEPDLAETNPTAFAQKLQEELVLAALRIEALQVAKSISQSPTLSTVSPQSRLKKPSPRRWNLNGSHMAKKAAGKSTQTDSKLCHRTSRIPQREMASPGDSGVSKSSLYSRGSYIEGESPHLPRDLDHSLGIAREEVVLKEKEAMEWKRKYEESRREVEEMRRIVMEYEKTIAEMIEGEQREKTLSHHTIQQLILEKDQALADLNSVEKSLADMFRRYEKMKDVLEGFRKNEDVLKKCAQEYLSRVRKEEQRYQALKIHAEEKLDKANSDISQVRAKAKQEQAAHQASLRKEQMKVDSLERTLEQKNKEIEELTKICDELIAKMGKS